MLIPQENGTVSAGPADILCILKLPTGRFHPAFFEEHPMPGPIKPIEELSFVRLKSKMHHTSGMETLEDATAHIADLRKKLIISDENVVSDEAFEVIDPMSVLAIKNWTTGQITLKSALKNQ